MEILFEAVGFVILLLIILAFMGGCSCSNVSISKADDEARMNAARRRQEVCFGLPRIYRMPFEPMMPRNGLQAEMDRMRDRGLATTIRLTAYSLKHKVYSLEGVAIIQLNGNRRKIGLPLDPYHQYPYITESEATGNKSFITCQEEFSTLAQLMDFLYLNKDVEHGT
jgi:hypothetical protein